jgi:heptosyltransferase-2
VHCVDEQGGPCAHYEQRSSDTLIIKLGAIGDVIRTTPLVRRIRNERPTTRIWWLTLTPELLPPEIDIPLPFTPQSLAVLHAVPFTEVINLDKDREACAIAMTVQAGIRRGYVLREGKPYPVNDDARHKYLTGVFDDLSRANRKSYLEEIFEISGYRFEGEEYLLDPYDDRGYVWKLPAKKKVVGLNTGCGGRWVSRLWPEPRWIALARNLKARGYTPLLLGGEQEHRKNLRIARASGARYLGHFPLPKFVNLVQQCDLVVSAVTMAMHIAIGLRKKLVLFNNTFNRHEFELYGRGVIIEPEFDCSCYYSPVCPNNCMQYIRVEPVLQSCVSLLSS